MLVELSRSFEERLSSVQGTDANPPDLYAIPPLNMEPPLRHSLLWKLRTEGRDRVITYQKSSE